MADQPPAALLNPATIARMAGERCMVNGCASGPLGARVDLVLVGVVLPEGGYGFAPCCGPCLRTNLDVFMVEPSTTKRGAT